MNISSILPLMALGKNVSNDLKTSFTMSAFIKDPKVRDIAAMMQAQAAGNESRKKTEIAEEMDAKVKLMTEAQLEAQSTTYASLPTAQQTAFLIGATQAMNAALSKQMATGADQRSGAALHAAFQLELAPVIGTSASYAPIADEMQRDEL